MGPPAEPAPGTADAVVGVDVPNVTRWFRTAVGDVEPPLRFTLVAAGRSNLTYRVEDSAGRAFALRRPPVSHVLATAHDMAREHRILSALRPTPVPVPATFGLCEDPEVNGAPFYVMEFVEGLVLRDAATAEAVLDPAVRPVVGGQIAEALAAVHAVDIDAVGLGDLAKREDYIARQIHRWSGQFAQTSSAGVLKPGAVEAVGEALAARIPDQVGATVVHGDFRIDNLVLHPDGRVAAVLDWELCTLGEPMADLGTFLDYWTVPDDGESILGREPANTLPGFSDGDELLARYAASSGRDVSDVGYFRAFGYWRVACILQGVYARYVGGAAAGDPAGVEQFPRTIARLADLAAETLGQR
jgi:aminoglycoside phosphotransferase (APT) family kinase protein